MGTNWIHLLLYFNMQRNTNLSIANFNQTTHFNVVNTSRSLPHSRLITGFVTRVTQQVPLVEHELLTLPEHLRSPPVFSGVRVTRSLALYECFVDRCLPCCPFSFGHCVVCSSSTYGFWLPPFGIFKLFLLSTSNHSCNDSDLGVNTHMTF